MGVKYCEDCGSVLNKDICSNCQEGLYIEEALSEDFRKKSDEQRIEWGFPGE